MLVFIKEDKSGKSDQVQHDFRWGVMPEQALEQGLVGRELVGGVHLVVDDQVRLAIEPRER